LSSLEVYDEMSVISLDVIDFATLISIEERSETSLDVSLVKSLISLESSLEV